MDDRLRLKKNLEEGTIPVENRADAEERVKELVQDTVVAEVSSSHAALAGESVKKNANLGDHPNGNIGGPSGTGALG
ncbi:hypothetical protein RIF29_38692 [Crotalaria pallida]|uniref:Uncharacterized protein n=1 Tax=Crotalaria pallida TaxID=3830 RepID=A0AAN9E0B6_CROPI